MPDIPTFLEVDHADDGGSAAQGSDHDLSMPCKMASMLRQDGLAILSTRFILAGELRPAVAVLDVQMPIMNGIEATRQIKAACPEVRVLILTAYDEDPYVCALLRAGADGYILKNADPDDLVWAVKTAAAGGKVLAPDVAAKVIARAVTAEPPAASEPIEPLTARELDVLRLARQGLTNKAIAAQLGLSDRTVQGHLANIYGKLGAASRTEAVTKALKLGWLALDDA